jgi:hypothetical protein
MAASFIQAAKSGWNSAVASRTATFSSGVTAGSFIVVGVQANQALTGITISDGSGDTVTILDALFTNANTTSKSLLAAFFAPTAGVTAVTATFSGTQPTFGDIFIWEFGGLTNPIVDIIKRATGSSSTPDSGSSGTLNSADEAAIGYLISANAVTAAGAGWSTVAGDGIVTPTNSLGEHRTVAATTAINGNGTSSAGQWLAYLATFKASTAGELLGVRTATATTGANPNNVAISPAIVVNIGDLIFVSAGQATNLQMTSASDNLGNTYSSAGTAGDAGTAAVSGFYTIVTVSGPLTNVAVAGQTTTADDVGIVVGAFKGVFTAVDKTIATVTDSASPYACPTTGTLAQAAELVIGYGAVAGTTTNGVLSATSPNLLAGQASPAITIRTGLGYQVVAATTAVAPAFTNSATGTVNGRWGTASFKIQVGTVYNDSRTESVAASETEAGAFVAAGTDAESVASSESMSGIKTNLTRIFGGFGTMLNTDAVNWAGQTLRVRLEPQLLAANTGGNERVTFEFLAGTSGTIAAAYIGHAAASGDLYDFDGNQVQLTFDGGSTTKAVSGASSVNSDYASAFAYDATKALIISVAFTGTTINLAGY